MTRPKISAAEWQVMNFLWDHSPAGSAEVVEHLQESTDWKPKTIKTLLARLVKKGFLTTEQLGNRYQYRAANSRQEAIQTESSSFLSRVFKGDTASLLLHFARSTELSEQDRQELRRLLEPQEEK
ncbi:MAG: BlaI/MecI/CopY family transcriptional regulator [Deltaproteobacteria bacterium]|nr:BlaI/MecI/CopY family transcriptional regulator [Deltaproteobacteria bacterium]